MADNETSDDDEFRRINDMIRANPERFMGDPDDRLRHSSNRELPVLGRYEADAETAEALREIMPRWAEFIRDVEGAKGRLVLLPDVEVIADELFEASRLLRKVERRIARLVLLSASVILPDEPTPKTLASPVRVEFDGWCVVVSPPEHDGGRLKVLFLRRVKDQQELIR